MVRTNKVIDNTVKVPACMVEQTLNANRGTADKKSIGAKLKDLLDKHDLKTSGSLSSRLERLLAYYDRNPEDLPTWIELSLYPVESETYQLRQQVAHGLQPREERMITFELNDDNELVEVF